MTGAGQPLKDIFDDDAVRAVARLVGAASPGFDGDAFFADVAPALAPLSIMQRARRIARGLSDHAPGAYGAQLDALIDALGGAPGGHDFVRNDFWYLPFCNFVGLYGAHDFARSLDALLHMTRWFSAEFDVRPYIIADQDRALARLLEAAASPDPAQRRLASEGSRPRLPWGVRLPALVADPRPLAPIFERLRDDPSESVRRSVANSLNDIAKDHPEFVVETARRWRRAAPGDGAERVIRHALRTLIKRGDPAALGLLGYDVEAPIRLARLDLASAVVTLGGALAFCIALHNDGAAPARAVIDYAVHHRKANGALRAKVFKLAERTIAPGAGATLSRRHAMRPITTRRYYNGGHVLEILVNGRSLGRADFVLETPRAGAPGS